jgi:hypothetical protein
MLARHLGMYPMSEGRSRPPKVDRSVADPRSRILALFSLGERPMGPDGIPRGDRCRAMPGGYSGHESPRTTKLYDRAGWPKRLSARLLHQSFNCDQVRIGTFLKFASLIKYSDSGCRNGHAGGSE